MKSLAADLGMALVLVLAASSAPRAQVNHATEPPPPPDPAITESAPPPSAAAPPPAVVPPATNVAPPPAAARPSPTPPMAPPPARALPVPGVASARPAPTPPSRIPVRLALQTEAAFGRLTGRFRNQLVGVRVDLQFSPRVSFGGYLGYVNLKGKDGRASSLLPYAQLEYMVGRNARAPVRVPLRFATGYLPRNGPVLRLATGLAFALTPRADLVTELLAPMLWVTNDQLLLSLNLSLELAIRF